MASIINATTTSGIAISGDTSGNLTIQSAGTNVATVTATGLGVGTTAPAYPLDVQTSAGRFQVQPLGGSSLSLYNGASGGNIALDSSGGITLFKQNGTESMRIDSSGNLIVGSNVSTTAKGNISLWGAGSTQTNIYLQKYAQVEGYFGFASGSSSNLYVNTGATFGSTGVYMTNGGTSWTSNSDERLKENLVPITDAVNKVNTLRAVTGNLISDEKKTKRPYLIAQDVQKVLPEAVSTNEIDGTEYLGVSYTDVIPLLVASIKELKALVDTQAQEIAALQAKVGA
jgi:Chaperone of endosialidase